MNKRQFKKYCKNYNVPQIISVQASNDMETWQHLRYLTRKNIVGKHPKNRRRRPYRYYKIKVNDGWVGVPVAHNDRVSIWGEVKG